MPQPQYRCSDRQLSPVWQDHRIVSHASPLTVSATSRALDCLDYALRFNTPRAYVHPLDRAIHIDSDLLDVCTKSPWRPVMRMADILAKSS